MPRRPKRPATKGWLATLGPLPRWEASPAGQHLRVFERGGEMRPIIGIPEPEAKPDIPDVKLSLRGLGHPASAPTRSLDRPAKDPVCSIRHQLLRHQTIKPRATIAAAAAPPADVVYANDRSPVHSGVWAQYAIAVKAPAPTAASPDKRMKAAPDSALFWCSSAGQPCIVCHMHPAPTWLNRVTGLMWWDQREQKKERRRKPAASAMYPKVQREY